MQRTARRILKSLGAAYLLLSASTAHSIPLLSFDVTDLNPIVGDQVSIDLVVTDVVDLFAFNLDVEFDQTLFSISSINPGTFLSGAGLTLGSLGILGFNTTTPGEIADLNDSLLGPFPGASGSGVLAVLNFDVIGTGVSTFSFGNLNAQAGTELISSLGSPITITGAPSTNINVSPVPEPSILLLLAAGATVLVTSHRRTKKSRNQHKTRLTAAAV